MSHETYHNLTLGFVKLTDAAPYVIAKERGFFARYGLNVDLQAQNSWATLRDKLEAGLLDAAHMLAPMPVASALGISGSRTDIIAPMITSQNGNGITISLALCNEIAELSGIDYIPFPMPSHFLRHAIEHRKTNNLAKLKFASVFPFSCHYLQLLDYFAQGDISTDDVELLFLPPTSMATSLRESEIDGFCVGGPWNAASVRDKTGATVITSYDIWQDQAEKVLGITNERYMQQPEVFHKLCAAIIDVCEWLKHVPNRFEAAKEMSDAHYLATDVDIIAPSLIGSCLTVHDQTPRHIPHYNRFSSVFSGNKEKMYLVNRPTIEQGEWLLEKITEAWPHLCDSSVKNVKIETCFRGDIFSHALSARL